MSKYSITNPVIYGIGAINSLGKEINKLVCKKIMVVTDEGVSKSGVLDKVKKILETSNIEYIVYDKVIEDPPDYIINEGGQLAKDEKIDGIVAVGGGSSMDAAKGINVLFNNELPVSKYFGNPFYNKGLPLVMVATTAGTGSENTSIGVITDTENNNKNSVIATQTLAILDPELTLTVPRKYTIATGMDAFSHAVEALTAKEPNPHSDVLAIDAIKKVVKSLPVCVENGNDLDARSDLLIASNFAGIAFNDALVHLGHSIAHSIGAKFHVVHGIACALAEPEVMKYASKFESDRVKIIGEAMGLKFLGEETDEEIGEKVASGIREFSQKIGVKSIKELGIKREELIGIANMVISDVTIGFAPKPITEKEAEKILANIFDNYAFGENCFYER
ncbi:iron-containing alcohol dehydrogenase [Clostridium sp.]|uniref:iron-containing alcohol dehydrogenase n=1 Tax=Clostridium sp. TaxID=1506 RepID=UPI002FDCD033